MRRAMASGAEEAERAVRDAAPGGSRDAASRASLPRRVVAAARAFWNRDPLTLAASIAFYTSLSFAPLLTLAVVAIAGTGSGFEQAFVAELGRVMGPQVAAAADLVLARVEGDIPDGVQGWLALGVVLFAASAVFGQLQRAINRIWGLDAQRRRGWRGWLHERVVSFGMLIGMGLLLASTFIASSVMAALFLDRAPWLAGAGELAATALFVLAFAAMFRYVPYVRSPWARCLRAGAVTALLFQAGKWVLGFYFAHAGLSDAYGPAGVVVVLMAWAYYVALLVLLGSALARPLTDPLAQPPPQSPPSPR